MRKGIYQILVVNVSLNGETIGTAAAAAKSFLWDPTDGSPPDSSVPGIFQARVLEWGAIAFSKL